MTAIIGWTDDAGAQNYLAVDCGETEGYRNTAETSDSPVESGSNVSDNVRANPSTFSLSGWITNVPVSLPATQVDGITQSPSSLGLPSGTVTRQKFSSVFDRVTVCDGILAGLVADGTVLTVNTRIRALSTVVLTSYGVDRKAETGDALAVTLEFKILRLVSTQTVAVPPTRRAQPQQNRDAQPATTPTPAQNRSLGAALADVL